MSISIIERYNVRTLSNNIDCTLSYVIIRKLSLPERRQLPDRGTKVIYVKYLWNLVLNWMSSPEGKKQFRYSVTSIVSVIVSEASFVILFGVHLAPARTSSIMATLIGAVPSYLMNRYWAFERREKNRFMQEIVPYLGVAIIGLLFSTWSVDFADSHQGLVSGSKLLSFLWVDGAYFGSFAVLWVAKFMFLNKILFSDRGSKVSLSVAPELD